MSKSSIQQYILPKQFQSICYILLLFTVITKVQSIIFILLSFTAIVTVTFVSSRAYVEGIMEEKEKNKEFSLEEKKKF